LARDNGWLRGAGRLASSRFLARTFIDLSSALVVLSVRPAEDWYRSAYDTIFQRLTLDGEWREAMRKLLRDRFCDRLHDKVAMIDAYERHNDEVRRTVPPDRLVEWSPSDGWGPICEGLGMAEPDEPFPFTNTTDEFRTTLGLHQR
jgi:hypothetical protein